MHYKRIWGADDKGTEGVKITLEKLLDEVRVIPCSYNTVSLN